MAVNLSNGYPLLSMVSDHQVVSYLPFKVGFSYILSVFLWFIGCKPCISMLVNLLFSFGTMIVLYQLRILGKKAAFYSAVLFSLMPSYILYSNIIGSEAGFSFCIVLGFYFLWKYSQNPSLRFCLLGGIALAGATIFRPSVIPIVLVCVLVIFWRSRTDNLKRVINPVCFVGSFYVVSLLIAGFLYCQTSYNIRNSTPWISLIHGSSFEAGGRTDAKLASLYEERKLSDDACKEIVIENYSNHLPDLPFHLGSKIYYMWLVEDFGMFALMCLDWDKSGVWGHWLGMNYFNVMALCNIYYYLVLLFGIMGIVRYPKHRAMWGFIVGVYFLFFIAHLFLEVGSRYHYPYTLLLMVPAGGVLQEFIDHLKSQYNSFRNKHLLH